MVRFATVEVLIQVYSKLLKVKCSFFSSFELNYSYLSSFSWSYSRFQFLCRIDVASARHVSPIGLRHVSLSHPQTPINRSLPKAFGGREDSEVQKLCKNQVSKPSRTSIPKLKNTRSRIIQNICLDPKVYGNQAQRSEKHQQTTNRWSSTDSSL